MRNRKRLSGVSFVLRSLPEPLPGAVAELVCVLEEPAEGAQRLFAVLRLQLQLGNHLFERVGISRGGT